MPGDKKVMVEVSEELAEALKRVQGRLDAGLSEIRSGGVLDFENIAGGVEAAIAELEGVTVRRLLQECDIDAPAIRVNGKRFTKVGRYSGTYFAKAAEVSVLRSLYREDGKRNAKTVDTVTLRVGAVDGWLPGTIGAMALLVQQSTSREAETVARKLGRLPYSRSSFEHVTHKLGTLYGVEKSRVEDLLIERFTLPESAASVSVQLDRFAIAMEEPKSRPVGRPKKGAPANPVDVVWRMAFSGTVVFHDEKGEALEKLVYGRMPHQTADSVAAAMAEDIRAVLLKKKLEVVRLSDGADDVSQALAAHICEEKLGVAVLDLIDFWHVVEKLAAAAAVLYGANAAATVANWKLRLLNNPHAPAQLLATLRDSELEHRRVGKQQPVHEAMTYLENQGDRMNYVAARSKGLPIGSGNVEATCKSFSQRMRRSGARWLPETGQHILDLRALALSNRFDEAIALTLAPLRSTVRRAG